MGTLCSVHPGREPRLEWPWGVTEASDQRIGTLHFAHPTSSWSRSRLGHPLISSACSAVQHHQPVAFDRV